MSTVGYGESIGSPPSFEQARNLRQKVRAAGLDPNYWYPAEWDVNLKRGQVIDISFWKRSIALFRGEDGSVHAIENRCAHRQLKLTVGHVEGCKLVCPYHGWKYDGQGRVVEISHTLFGRDMPNFRVASFPVAVRYGMIWIFPGDAELASSREIPEIPELEGADRWAAVPVDFTWRAHHSMIIDNVSDFTHAYLHRKFAPFSDAELTGFETRGDDVHLSYDTKVGRGRISGLFVDRSQVNTNHMDLCYQYPYQWSNTDDQIKHWLFLRPIDEQHTRAFFIFYFKSLKIPFLPLAIPRPVMQFVMKIAKQTLVRPLLKEDGIAVEAEQEGYDRHYDAPLAELNPVVRAFQQVTVRKWEAFLAHQADKQASRTA
ncbi:MAG: aromatic ring-hydroxylating dioxygenase subunit alpha [Deltaproteobacteria bacterium]|nr:aromatic ring-hydroxylating dioxygenase subunit alpha [Deltaproteobacteria bacterium]